MSKVILICGKICSGKTYYTNKLSEKYNAVLLSCDEIESMIFHHSLGSSHDIVAKDIQAYLHKKAAQIVNSGSNVILDWGFWTSSERQRVTELYKSQNISVEWHYIDIDDEVWKQNIESRNAAVKSGKTTDYEVDDGLLQKLISLFEIPQKNEMDVWYKNTR